MGRREEVDGGCGAFCPYRDPGATRSPDPLIWSISSLLCSHVPLVTWTVRLGQCCPVESGP